MKNERQQDNERRAAVCRDGKAGACLMLAEICAQCSVRPGRPGCVLFGTDRGFYDAPETSGADGAADTEAGDLRAHKAAQTQEFQRRNIIALRIGHSRACSSLTARGARHSVAHYHDTLHEAIAATKATEEDFFNHFAAEIAAHEAAQEQEGAPAEMGGRRTISPEDLEEVDAASRDGVVMACDHSGTCAGRVWHKREECGEVPTSCDHAMSCVMRECSPAAMPEDMAARIAKRMRREEARVLRRVCVRHFVCGMVDCFLICFRVLWIAAVVAIAIAAGIALIALFMMGVLHMIY